MFERIEAFFRRLEIYTRVTPDQGMINTTTAIMVGILDFVGIATEEVEQGRMSKSLR